MEMRRPETKPPETTAGHFLLFVSSPVPVVPFLTHVFSPPPPKLGIHKILVQMNASLDQKPPFPWGCPISFLSPFNLHADYFHSPSLAAPSPLPPVKLKVIDFLNELSLFLMRDFPCNHSTHPPLHLFKDSYPLLKGPDLPSFILWPPRQRPLRRAAEFAGFFFFFAL